MCTAYIHTWLTPEIKCNAVYINTNQHQQWALYPPCIYLTAKWALLCKLAVSLNIWNAVTLLKCECVRAQRFKEDSTCLAELSVHEQCEWFDTQQNGSMAVSQRGSTRWGCFILTWAAAALELCWHCAMTAGNTGAILLIIHIDLFHCCWKTLK